MPDLFVEEALQAIVLLTEFPILLLQTIESLQNPRGLGVRSGCGREVGQKNQRQ